MLNEPPRNAIAMPNPMRMSGTARTRVAEVNAYQEPNAPLNNATSAIPGSYPARYRPPDNKVNPMRTAASAHHSRITSADSSRRFLEHHAANLIPCSCRWSLRQYAATNHHGALG